MDLIIIPLLRSLKGHTKGFWSTLKYLHLVQQTVETSILCVSSITSGAAVMSGEINGLQAKVKSVAPQALFTHCYAHRLNLILQDTIHVANLKSVEFFLLI